MDYRVMPPTDLVIEALYDYWAFIELIKFQGGINAWDQCHFDFALHLQAPQLMHHGRLTGKLLERWNYISKYPKKQVCDTRLLKMPRGHRKSTLVLGYLMWRIWRNPNIRIAHCTNIKDLSESFVREMRAYFEDEELQETVWNRRPHIKGKLIPDMNKDRVRRMDSEAKDTKVIWNNKKLQVIRGSKFKEPTLLATSTQTKETGVHVDLVVFDDVVDFDNSRTETSIKKVKRWAGDMTSVLNNIKQEVLLGVLPDGTNFTEILGNEKIVTGTHYDPKDYYATQEEKHDTLEVSVLEYNIYQNGIDNTKGYIMQGFDAKQEAKLRADLEDLPGVFDAQYLNKVHSKELQTLSTKDVIWIPRREMLAGREGQLFTFYNGEDVECFEPILAVDPAISLKAQADDTAIVVGGISSTDRLIVGDAHAGHFTPEATCELVARLVKRWGIRRVYFENVAFQELLRKQIVKKLSDENLQCGVIPIVPKGNKWKRIENGLSGYFSNGDVVMASHLKLDPRIINPIDFFGRVTTRDDVPDALEVVASNSHKPTRTSVNVRKVYLTSLNQRPSEYNPKYGGMY